MSSIKLELFLQHLLSGTFFPQPIWRIPVVPQIFSGSHLPAEVNPDIISHAQWYPTDGFYAYHTYYNIHITYCIVILIFIFCLSSWNEIYSSIHSEMSSLRPILRSTVSDSLWKQEKARRRQFFSRKPRGMSPAHIFTLSMSHFGLLIYSTGR